MPSPSAWPRCSPSAATGLPTGLRDGRSIDVAADYAALGTTAGHCAHCHTGRCPVGITTQDPALEARLDVDHAAESVANFLRATTMEVTALARACGKSDVHHLEPEDLVALTVEAAAMAGSRWPGPTGSPAGRD